MNDERVPTQVVAVKDTYTRERTPEGYGAVGNLLYFLDFHKGHR